MSWEAVLAWGLSSQSPIQEDRSSQDGGAGQGWVSLLSFPPGSWCERGASSESLM